MTIESRYCVAWLTEPPQFWKSDGDDNRPDADGWWVDGVDEATTYLTQGEANAVVHDKSFYNCWTGNVRQARLLVANLAAPANLDRTGRNPSVRAAAIADDAPAPVNGVGIVQRAVDSILHHDGCADSRWLLFRTVIGATDATNAIGLDASPEWNAEYLHGNLAVAREVVGISQDQSNLLLTQFGVRPRVSATVQVTLEWRTWLWLSADDLGQQPTAVSGQMYDAIAMHDGTPAQRAQVTLECDRGQAQACLDRQRAISARDQGRNARTLVIRALEAALA